MKQITFDSEKEYCYHVYVIDYALYAGKGKAVMKEISEVCKLAGLSRRTLQYYDDTGILVAERSENNYRLYDDAALKKLWQIMVYKEMGFKLKEISQLLQITNDEERERLQLRIDTVQKEISKLEDLIEFISLTLTDEMPQAPEENGEMTYMERIKELKKKMKSRGREKRKSK